MRVGCIPVVTTLLLATAARAQTELVTPRSLVLPSNKFGSAAFDRDRGTTVVMSGPIFYSGLLGSVAEWNGSDWAVSSPAGTPYATRGGATAYDERRRRIVFWDPSGTYEWDGTTWLLRAPAAGGPPSRMFGRMVYDASRDRMVLFGGQGDVSRHLDDLWEWNGQSGTWTRVTPTASPPGRFQHGMTYDRRRARVLLFGGLGVSGRLADTWEYDGATRTWTDVSPTTSPSPREAMALAYDESRDRTFLYGGYRLHTDTWEWNGASATWTRLSPSTNPGVRIGATFTYDAARAEPVLYGGQYSFDGGHAETWALRGGEWHLLANPTAPPNAGAFAMAYDEVRGVTVMLATEYPTTDPPMTWVWDQGWTERPVAASPPSVVRMIWDPLQQRITALDQDSGVWFYDPATPTWRQLTTSRPFPSRPLGLAIDPTNGQLLAFGSYDDVNFQILAETWRLDTATGTWTRLAPRTSPPPYHRFAMVTDLVQRRVVLHTGRFQTNATWEWDGSDWTVQNTTMTPGEIALHVATYDVARQRVVLIGKDWQGISSIWEYDGTDWTLREPATTRSAVFFAAAYDSRRREIVVQTGFGGGTVIALGVTQLYRSVDPATYAPFGTGCPGTAGTPTLSAEPWQNPWADGGEFVADVRGLPNGAAVAMMTGKSDRRWGGLRLPFPLDGMGMPGCSLLVSVDVTTSLPPATNGTTEFRFAIPATTALIGNNFYQQAIVLDPGANSAGLVVTGGACGTFGGR